MAVVTHQRKSNEDMTFLDQVKEQFTAWNDPASAQLLEDLLHKRSSQELTIAFCGHFSAGKSTLINTLCETKVLPSGPVPTSANVVSIRNGVPRALIYSATEQLESGIQPQRVQEVSLSELDEYCRNGGDYSAVEVWSHVPLLEEYGVFMDTPGVDSTDDGHQKATHSALHLADVVIYVMDYNHVQSENNLMFAKSLSDWGKPLYLVVNQIDKHREREVPFQNYREEVETAFSRWQVNYKSLIFTSLKVPEHHYNQYEALRQLIRELLQHKQELLSYSLNCSVHHASEDYIDRLKESHADEKDRLLEAVGGEEQMKLLQDKLEQLRQEKQELQEWTQQERDALRTQLDKLLSNANLMPAEIRELAGTYLESLKPGFRKGLFFSGSKTRQEQEERAHKFIQVLQEQVASQLEWHVAELLRRWGEAHHIWNEDWQQQLKSLLPIVEEATISQTVPNEAAVSGEYLLNYCNRVASELKAGYRRSFMEVMESMLPSLEKIAEEKRELLEGRIAELEKQSVALSRYVQLQREEEDRAAALAQLLPPRQELTPGLLPEVSELRPLAEAAASAAGARTAAPATAPRTASGAEEPQGGAAHGRRQRLTRAAEQLQAAAALLGQYPAMASAARGVASRAAALAGGSFTMALFGAFSAGKSSFANALLGEDVLPVSPHPTTAAINRILAPQGEHTHGSAQVKMKSRADLWEDLKVSFEILQLGVPAEQQWIETVRSLQPTGIHPAGLVHYGFLKAAAEGWTEAEQLLGTTVLVDLPAYRSFVADETKSCFVESIDLYYSCELTNQGIVLVDTPGADSLHARHTGVTFQYMKHADALVFITYFNHAFSKGDRQFLAQLGRVKDSFALDKMFFIVNAADLADSEEELEQVVKHVESNLRQSGVRTPNIYPLSSMMALEGRLQGDTQQFTASRFAAFEEAVTRFASTELPNLSIQAAIQELRAAKTRALEWGSLSRQDKDARERKRQELSVVNKKAEQFIGELADSRYDREIAQETKELLFHVRQRLGYAMTQFFQESFHPSLLRDDVGSIRQIFSDCGRELERTLYRELEQELLATTLRLEHQGKQLLLKASTQTAERIQQLEQSILLMASPDQEEWGTPKWEEAALLPDIDWNSLWSSFKSPKQFFEGGGRDRLRQRNEPLLKEAIAVLVNSREDVISSYYQQTLSTAFLRQAEQLNVQLRENLTAIEQSLASAELPEYWDQLAERLSDYEKFTSF